ncbi:ATP-binding cassette domain-containing protein [Rhizobium mongolense]
MLRSIAGLVDISAGQIMTNGRRLDDVPIYKRDIGLVFQNYALFPHKSVFDNVAFGPKYHNVPKTDIARKVGKALEMIRLPGSERKLPRNFPAASSSALRARRRLRERARIEIKKIRRKLALPPSLLRTIRKKLFPCRIELW